MAFVQTAVLRLLLGDIMVNSGTKISYFATPPKYQNYCFQIPRRIMTKRQRSFTTDEVVDMLNDSELSSDEEVEEPNMPGSDSEWSCDELDMGRRETNEFSMLEFITFPDTDIVQKLCLRI